MTSNSTIFSTFQSKSSPSTVTLENVSQSCVLGLGTIFPTPSISLSSILSSPNFSFNLVSMTNLLELLNVVSHSFLIIVSSKIL